jgi:hypothetical protein
MSDTIKAFFFFAAIPFLLLYGTWAWAVTFVSMWSWFVIPTFHLDPLSFKQAIAVSAIVGIFIIKAAIGQHKTEKHPDGTIDWSKAWTAMWVGICAPWITWVIYWFIKTIFI